MSVLIWPSRLNGPSVDANVAATLHSGSLQTGHVDAPSCSTSFASSIGNVNEQMKDLCVSVGFSTVAINYVFEPAAKSKQVRPGEIRWDRVRGAETRVLKALHSL